MQLVVDCTGHAHLAALEIHAGDIRWPDGTADYLTVEFTRAHGHPDPALRAEVALPPERHVRHGGLSDLPVFESEDGLKLRPWGLRRRGVPGQPDYSETVTFRLQGQAVERTEQGGAAH